MQSRMGMWQEYCSIIKYWFIPYRCIYCNVASYSYQWFMLVRLLLPFIMHCRIFRFCGGSVCFSTIIPCDVIIYFPKSRILCRIWYKDPKPSICSRKTNSPSRFFRGEETCQAAVVLLRIYYCSWCFSSEDELLNCFSLTLLCDWKQVNPKDYNDSTYDRGHVIPAADFAHDTSLYEKTFSMINISPQVGFDLQNIKNLKL